MLDRPHTWSSANAAIPLVTSLRRVPMAENHDELVVLQPSRVLMRGLYLTIATKAPIKKHPSSSVGAHSNPSPFGKGVCYSLGLYEDVTPLGLGGLMLHFAHKAALGDRPAFKSSDPVPTHDINPYLLDSPCCAWQERIFRQCFLQSQKSSGLYPMLRAG